MTFGVFNFNSLNLGGFGLLPAYPTTFAVPAFTPAPLFNFKPFAPLFDMFSLFNFMPKFNDTYTPKNYSGSIFDGYKLPDISFNSYNPVSYVPDYTPAFNFNFMDFTKNSKVLSQKPAKVSLTQNTSLKNVAQIYNKEKGIKLANEAIEGLSTAQKGYCARAVKSAISDAGLGAYESGNADDMPEILRRNSNFKEVKVKGTDLAKLPAGCVIAYDRGAAGYSSRYGHVEIKGDGNQAISFFVNNNIKPSDNVSVFVPV